MQSLRTRRPSQQGRSQQQKLSKLPGSASPRKSKVDDRIKKRLSTRYAQISAPTSSLGVPDVPSLPVGTSGRPSALTGTSVVNNKEEVRRDPRAVDVKILDEDEFDPDAYLKVKLTNSTEVEIKSLRSSLETSKSVTSSDLQRNVIKNYAEFFVLSKEIYTLENDMLELKESLSEWKAMPSLLHIDTSTPLERRYTNRSSIADLRDLYANQIATLHTRIEGSSKFVPTIPGRHIVSETADITSLNAASYKPEQNVHFVLLDDALLVARSRKRKPEREGYTSMVAVRCWNLADIVVLDIKDSKELTNVFKIKDGKNVYPYRTEKISDKQSLLSSFREVAEQFADRKRKQREAEHERRKSVWATNSHGASQFNAPAIPELPTWLKEMSGVDKSQDTKDTVDRDAKWVNEYSDNLSVAIALRDWDKAVSLVETGEEPTVKSALLSSKLPLLKDALIRALLNTLGDSHHRKTAVVHLSSLLTRLGAGLAARTTFLCTRTNLIHKRVRMIPHEGDITLYVTDLTIVVFTSIKHSADWYFGSFKEHDSASTFVEWAKDQFQTYMALFKTQVYGSDVRIIDECIQITLLHSRRLLGENGLDFSFLIDQSLQHFQDGRKPISRRRIHSLQVADQSAARMANAQNASTEPEVVAPPRDTVAIPPRSRDRPGSIADLSPARPESPRALN